MLAIYLNIIDRQQKQCSDDMCYIRTYLHNGDIGITPGHIPLITTLKQGTITASNTDGDTIIIMAEVGFIAVQPT